MPQKLKGTVAMSLATVFALLSLFHVIGALGHWRSLAVIPVVSGEVPHYPSSSSWLAVAAALALAALVVLVRGDIILPSIPSRLSTLACLILGAVFVLRAIGEFRFFGFFRSVTDTRFAFWDTLLYTPLCLVIGVSALWLARTPRAP